MHKITERTVPLLTSSSGSFQTEDPSLGYIQSKCRTTSEYIHSKCCTTSSHVQSKCCTTSGLDWTEEPLHPNTNAKPQTCNPQLQTHRIQTHNPSLNYKPWHAQKKNGLC